MLATRTAPPAGAAREWLRRVTTPGIGVQPEIRAPPAPAAPGAGRRDGGAAAAAPPATTTTLIWPTDELLTVPNGLSLLRAALGPAVAYSACCGHYELAAAGVAAAGVTDFLDGAIARAHPSQRSVLGSHLDPLADKLFLSVSTAALGLAGALPAASSAALVASHATLVAGAFLHRATDLRWEWTGAREFFMVRAHAGGGAARRAVRPADTLSPLLVGKALTVCQYVLLGAACAGAMGAPAPASEGSAAAVDGGAAPPRDAGPPAAVHAASYALALTSVAIIPAYAYVRRANILAAGRGLRTR